MDDRAAWLAERRKGIGGSDCASLMNEGYGCRRRLWYDKVGVPESDPEESERTKDAKELGNYLEPMFANKYAEKTGRTIMVRDEPYVNGIIRCNVDRLALAPDGKGYGVLEIKAVSRGVFFNIKREGLPPDYILEVQHGLIASGLSWGSYAIGNRDSGELLWWDVEKNDTICKEIEREAAVFWGTVQAADEGGPGAPYDRLEPDDRRCQSCHWRTTCQGAQLIQLEPPGEYEQDESLAALTNQYAERNALKKEADELVEETKAEIQSRMAGRPKVIAGGTKIQFYEKDRAGYTVKPSRYWFFGVYPKKERK